jgi:hypothetical protein
MRKFPVSVLTLTAAIALGCGERLSGGRTDPLPASDDIKSMKATYADPVEDKMITFVVPPSHWSKIRDALLPAWYDEDAAKWKMLGELDIEKKRGGRVVVWLFSISQGPGAFAAGPTREQRVYYRGGQSAKLKQALRAAYEASQEAP